MSNRIQKPITYLFVDGSNFRQYFNENTQKWFEQEVEFDFQLIKSTFQAEKIFYYDCIDDIKSDNENQQNFEKRVFEQEKYLNKIREVVGCHVHLGSLSGKGKKKRQKEVDVLLAVQMMEHAVRGNMQKAVLLSGDKDFRPLVESLVRLGLFVEVVGDHKHISQDLIHAADSHKKLTIDEYYKFTNHKTQDLRKKTISYQGFFLENAKKNGFSLLKKGNAKSRTLKLFEKTSGGLPYCIVFENDKQETDRSLAWHGLTQKDVIDYAELKLGQKIIWE